MVKVENKVQILEEKIKVLEEKVINETSRLDMALEVAVEAKKKIDDDELSKRVEDEEEANMYWNETNQEWDKLD